MNALLFFFLMISLSTFGQSVIVKGIALDSTGGRNKVVVTIKERSQNTLHNDDLELLLPDTLFVDREDKVMTNSRNKFKIKANLTDSLVFRSYRHLPQSYLVADLIDKKEIKITLSPEACKEYIPCEEDSQKLYVFIGKKIEVVYTQEEYYCDRMSMDLKYKATYQIVENLYGDFKNDIIQFTVYDHYGRPGFSEFENVILYVVEYCGKLYHVKYLYNDVYKTKNGKWASPYKPHYYKKIDSLTNNTPVIIDFQDDVLYKYDNDISQIWLSQRFAEPYYQVNGNTVKAIYGNYANDVFEIMKKTALKARGFFKE